MKKIALPTAEGFRMISMEQIIRCEADRNYTTIILNDGSNVIVCKSLKTLENALCATLFLRIHHSHLVNLDYIEQFKNLDGGTLYLTNGDTVEVSRAKKKGLLARVNLI